MSKTAFLFPGQGAQFVGMGKDLYESFTAAKAVFDRAEEITSLPIRKLCFEGPEEDLARTDHAQPCMFTHSTAVLACMASLPGPSKVDSLKPAAMAGLSLGEYTALFAAGMLSFRSALELVTRRGAAMQSAAEAHPSSMVAVMGIDETQARDLCAAVADGQVLTPANFNCPGQVVLSGETDACQRAAERAEEFGARGATVLNVAGAFHSELMAPAAKRLQAALDAMQFDSPSAPPTPDAQAPAQPSVAQAFASPETVVLANVDAKPYDDPTGVKQRLLGQLIGAVRWQQCCEALLADGVEQFYEIGPGKVLTGLMRRVDRKANVTPVGTKEDIQQMKQEAG